MMASNAELHSFICLPQFMDLSPESAVTMLTAVAKCHRLAVFKYKVHPNCQNDTYTAALAPSPIRVHWPSHADHEQQQSTATCKS